MSKFLLDISMKTVEYSSNFSKAKTKLDKIHESTKKPSSKQISKIC